MSNAFDFELTASDEASASIARIEEALKNLNPLLDHTRDSLELGGQESRDNLDDLNSRFDSLAQNARNGVQFIGDLVPPLKTVGSLTLGLGGAAVAINAVKNNLTNFANAGYRIDTIAKNVSMTTDAFQELTGAMVENGSERDAAENSIAELYKRAGDANRGGDKAFMGLLLQRDIHISRTKEGMADVGKLVSDLNKEMQRLSPARQALFADKLGLSPELLSYLRNTTSEVQRLKDQAKRDGLIFSGKDISNALAFRQQLNGISSAYDGMLLKGQAWLGQSETLKNSVDQIKQVVNHGLDSATIGSILTFNNGGEQAELLRKAQGDDKLKETLSFKEKMDLSLGYASPDLLKKLNSYYSPGLRAEQLKSDLEKAFIQPPSEIVNPVDRVLKQPKNNAFGLRHNNPGNLEAAPNATGRAGKDNRFVTFGSAHDGIAALSRQLQLYGDRGNNTLDSIIHTFAPKNENDTQAYINAVSKMTGFNPYERLDLHSPDVLQQLMPAIIKHENTEQPFSSEAIKLAIGDSVNDPRWQGLRDVNKLIAQRQSGLFDYRGDRGSEAGGNSRYEPTSNITASLFGGETGNDAAGYVSSNQELVTAITSLNRTMQDSKMQIELTLVDSKTGERRTIVGNDGARVSTSMNLQ